ncbi:GNAT family N-acetyltransferase [Nonomuraea rhizosphaerae]|uniref:GNAT family N-acetyltransferase n=1 Tax=Nonomuraea rhizosphaerae TaxID=2665663 RepID=UPI001C5DC452|nr:GNAT family N-acetyltransferase [Nonomuraea rhizosphaerae]
MDLALVTGPEDLTRAADVLARAFHDDPVIEWLLPGGAGAPLMFATLARHVHAITEVAYDADGVMAGAALWDPPGHEPDLEAGVAGFVRAMGERVSYGMVLDETFARHRPAAPHWYLAQIGTLPEARGTGVGGALLRAGLARCEGPVYLESSKESNVPLYEKYGFRVTEEIRLPGGPSVWGMWRGI